MGKVAFVFAGQGAQYPGMGKDIYESSAAAKQVYSGACAGLLEMCFSGTQEQLNITENTQPCLFLTDTACAAALNECGIFADGAAGFSLGEIAALSHCGVLEPSSALELVTLRGRVMQECANANMGTMLAILRLPASEVVDICRSVDGAWAVNFNCPSQTVAACLSESANALKELVAQHGGRAMPLAVSGAFHTPLMSAATNALSSALSKMNPVLPKIPLYSNITAKPYCGDIASLIANQASSPVEWQRTIENMISDGFDTFIECGPGKTLCGLVAKIDAGVRTFNVCDLATLEKTVLEVTVC